MNREEAKQKIRDGVKMTHTNFDKHEYVTIDQDGMRYEFEDGNLCTESGFWAWRATPQWDTGWSEFQSIEG